MIKSWWKTDIPKKNGLKITTRDPLFFSLFTYFNLVSCPKPTFSESSDLPKGESRVVQFSVFPLVSPPTCLSARRLFIQLNTWNFGGILIQTPILKIIFFILTNSKFWAFYDDISWFKSNICLKYIMLCISN